MHDGEGHLGRKLTAVKAKAALKALLETPEGNELALFNQRYNNTLENWGTNDQAYFIGFSFDLDHAAYLFSSPRRHRMEGGLTCEDTSL